MNYKGSGNGQFSGSQDEGKCCVTLHLSFISGMVLLYTSFRICVINNPPFIPFIFKSVLIWLIFYMATLDIHCQVWVGNGGGASKVSLRFLVESTGWMALLLVEMGVTRRARLWGSVRRWSREVKFILVPLRMEVLQFPHT